MTSSPAAAVASVNGRAPLSILTKLAYVSGNAGNVLTYQLILTFLLALYLPPEGKGAALVPASVFGISTFLFASVVARGIDTFFDPWIANISDRSTAKMGRRRFFMLIASVPLAASAALVFFPPTPTQSTLNLVFMCVVMTAYYCLFSTYVAPYLALLPELAPEKTENTRLSAMQAFAALIGGLIATVIAPAIFLGDNDVDRVPLQHMAAAMGVVAFVLLAITVLFVNENKLVQRDVDAPQSHLGPLASLKATFEYKPFIPYVFGTNLFFCGFTIIQSSSPYYVEVLLNRPLKELGSVTIPLFGVAAISFPIVSFLANKFGKRTMMILGALMLAVVIGVGIPLIPSMPHIAGFVFGLCGFPIACFLALPNAILADICGANARETGQRREAMFFGAQGFIQKAALGVAGGSVGWIIPAFGNSHDHPLGVQLTGPLAAVVLVLAAVCYWFYPENEVQAKAT